MRRTPGIRFLDHNGTVIAERGAKYGVRVSLGALPAFVPKAFLAAEDRRFYRHGGVDPRAILRAAWRDIALGRAAEGGSTIAQQLARTLFLTSDHTIKRKVQEVILATKLEDQLGKDGVLDLYLNRTYFGAGAYGLDAASQTYFGRSAVNLTLAEVAVLAALPNAPTRLAPTTNMVGAWSRARRVLKIMTHEGWVTPGEAAKAETSPPELTQRSSGEGDWSYVLDQAASQVDSLIGGAGADLVVRLTVDSKLQTTGVAAVRGGVLGDGRGRHVSQGAMVVLASDGAIRVMVGGLDHQASAFNRVTQAKRQPGSAFKAFVFGAAMEAGDKPTDIRNDAPISRGAWTPDNYGGKFLGPVTLAKALALSINSVAVRLTLEIGPAQVAAFARRCGITKIPIDPGPSIALGAYEVTPLELASAYQVFQSGGTSMTPYLVEAVFNTQGQELYTHASVAPVRVLDPLYASRMVRMLKGVVTSGTGASAALGRPVAGKTGTSQHWRDAWFVGFTPDLLAAVWVGNDDGSPMDKVTGGEIPSIIWKHFMWAAEAQQPAVDFVWLQPEPVEPPSDDVDNNAVNGSAYVDEPSGDVTSHHARPLPRENDPTSSAPDPDEAASATPPESSFRSDGPIRPEGEGHDPLPSSPPSL
jgi:penicillin-binding protein 1A